jgi:hypothetical protein
MTAPVSTAKHYAEVGMSGRITMLCGIATAIGLLTASKPADAGLVQSFPVVIDTVNRVAQGSLGSARNSSDSVQYIGCWNTLNGYEDNNGSIPPGDPNYHLVVQQGGGCYAVNSANQPVSCALVPGEMPPMASDSLIAFSWDANGNCTGLQVWTYSNTSPKQP